MVGIECDSTTRLEIKLQSAPESSKISNGISWECLNDNLPFSNNFPGENCLAIAFGGSVSGDGGVVVSKSSPKLTDRFHFPKSSSFPWSWRSRTAASFSDRSRSCVQKRHRRDRGSS